MTRHSLHQLTARTHWLSPDSRTDRPVLGVVAGAQATLIVDAGNSPDHARALLSAIAQSKLAPPRYLALTHWHWDHIFGAAELALVEIASLETQRIVAGLSELDWGDAALDERVARGEEIAFCRDMIKAELPSRAGLSIRPPAIGFAQSLTLDLGDLSCVIEHVGGDHAADSSVVYLPAERVVFLGDCIYDDIYHQPRRLTTTRLFPLLERLLSYDADWYLPAHDDKPLSRAELVAEAALLRAIGALVTERGHDRAAIVAALPAATGLPLADDHSATADAFIAGLA